MRTIELRVNGTGAWRSASQVLLAFLTLCSNKLLLTTRKGVDSVQQAHKV